MKCKTLLLPLLAGLALGATNAYARNPEVNTPANLASTSLSFTENKGQIINQFQEPRPDIDFRLSAGNSLSVFVGSGQIHYQWAKSMDKEQSEMNTAETALSGRKDNTPKTYQLYRMDVTLLGANPHAQRLTEGRQTSFERYFQPWVNKNNSNQGVVVHSYQKITYKNIYPNIDWVLYIKGHTVEYDFVVHPGGKVSDIRLQYSGATKLALQDNGSLLATTPMGKVAEQAPYSFQEDGTTVASGFVLKDNILSFTTGKYSGTLTIDPTLEWGTYFGGSDEEMGRSIAVDKNGNVYLLGTTGSLSNIATSGAYQTTYGGGSNPNGADAFLSKWDTDGNLLWATYYGGDNIDIAYSVACDTVGNVYFGGYTKSASGIATAGSYQDVKAGTAARSDAFLVKFDTAGQRDWATYFGDTENEANTCLAIACDKMGHIYITADTRSSDNIATTGAYQSTIAGYYDVFLAKFDWNGNLDWSTYYGGSDGDYSEGIAIDATGAIYITGQTLSTTGIASTGAYQTTAGGMQDAFLAKFDTAGQLVWGTYIGGNHFDNAIAICHSDWNDVYIVGTTNSTSGIGTVNCFKDSLSGTDDGFLFAFDSSGQLKWSTYYGGMGSEPLTSVWTNSHGEVYFSGETSSDSGIATQNGLNPVYAGSYDVFLAKFDSTGERLQGSYIGGGSIESSSIISGFDNYIYLSGFTFSGTGIATPNAYQSTLNASGTQDAFLIKINDCKAPAMPDEIMGDSLICSGTEHIYALQPVAGAVAYTFILPSGWSSQTINGLDSIAIIPNDSNGILKVVAISACGGLSDTQSLAIRVLPSPTPQIVNNNGVLSATQSYPTYQWLLNGAEIPGANTPTYLPGEDGDYSLRVSNSEGCTGISDTITITGMGISILDKSTEITAYPNPAKNYLMLQSPVHAKAMLYSTDGRALLNKITLKKGINRIDLKGISSGLYWLKIVTDKGVQTVCITVNR